MLWKKEWEPTVNVSNDKPTVTNENMVAEPDSGNPHSETLHNCMREFPHWFRITPNTTDYKQEGPHEAQQTTSRQTANH